MNSVLLTHIFFLYKYSFIDWLIDYFIFEYLLRILNETFFLFFTVWISFIEYYFFFDVFLLLIQSNKSRYISFLHNAEAMYYVL